VKLPPVVADPSGPEARDTLERYLRQHGLRLTRQRQSILEVFLANPRHISIEDLYRKVCDQAPGVGFATVYRTLKLLTQCGLAEERHFQGKRSRYEPAAAEHHDHCICTSCGAIVEFESPEIEKLQEQTARRLGFLMNHHRMELYGLCSRCRPRRVKSRESRVRGRESKGGS
jgi:Fur family ferric uptake transcriptional regulator